MTHINSAVFPKVTLQIREDRFSIPLSAILKQISRLSLLTARWFTAHRHQLAQYGFFQIKQKLNTLGKATSCMPATAQD